MKAPRYACAKIIRNLWRERKRSTVTRTTISPPEHGKWLADKAKAAEQSGSTAYFDNLLDKLNVDICLANRAMMAPYLDPKRYRWVFFVDSFFFPFDNTQQKASTPDMGVYIPLQEKMLSRWKKQEGVEGLPADLAGYEDFVRRTMADNQQKHGGVAIKFEAAYFRSLYFADPPREHAEAIYNKYRAGGVPTPGEYKQFQDYIFRVLVDQAGKLHLPVHIHSAVGIGDYFSLQNGNVLNLENVLRDPRYKNVNFVLLHGGWPYEREAALLTAVKNVYLDTSFQSELLYPSQFKEVLKQLLTLYPDKMMYGSDAFPFNDALGAEESMWLAARTTRTGLAAALAELVEEGAFSEAKALELARNYLHDNAARLYGELEKMTTKSCKYIPWNTVEHEKLNDLIAREMVVGDNLMLARVFLKKGAHVPEHHHHNEQVTYILEGALKFAIDGKEIVVRAGEVLCIPSNMPHEAWAIEDTLDLDVFNPPREDWLSKSDDYLRLGIPRK